MKKEIPSDRELLKEYPVPNSPDSREVLVKQAEDVLKTMAHPAVEWQPKEILGYYRLLRAFKLREILDKQKEKESKSG